VDIVHTFGAYSIAPDPGFVQNFQNFEISKQLVPIPGFRSAARDSTPQRFDRRVRRVRRFGIKQWP
jgi:hypothetical protein